VELGYFYLDGAGLQHSLRFMFQDIPPFCGEFWIFCVVYAKSMRL